ncbi:MAG: hypothetical protein IJ088_14575 [Clostridia bacterium]|nr:hypothetical protein [Clostridia bacterium]
MVVIPTEEKLPKLGSSRINDHLLFVDCEGKDIFFNISHAMCGGRGFLPWLMTNVYQYVVERYRVHPNAPGLRKVGSALLPGETEEPSMDNLTSDEPIYRRKSVKAPILAWDYLNGLVNPLKRKPNYLVFELDQEGLMRAVRELDSSVISFFFMIFARILDQVLPEKNRTIVGEAAHNPRESMGLPHSHSDFLSHVYVDFDRDRLRGDLTRLGTMTRGQIILQTDPTVSHEEVRRLFTLYEEIDQQHGLRNKRKYMAKHSLSTGKDVQHGSFILNYTGQMDWGEVADYVDFYAFIIEGHYTIEITALADRVFVGLMQLVRTDRYENAFMAEMERFGIPCKVHGPYPKRLMKHELPHST